MQTGSSPLARGLLSGMTRQTVDRGIIPARAGFTEDRGPYLPDHGDHPRSRGVYTYLEWCADGVPGSSPLARGLLEVRAVPGLGVGIIPARAGFTFRCRATNIPVTDHPRSRGVYDCCEGCF